MSGIIKPPQWSVDPRMVSPEWRWAWRELRALVPLWGAGTPFDVSFFHKTLAYQDAGATGPWGVGPHGPVYRQDGGNTTERLYIPYHAGLNVGSGEMTLVIFTKITSFATSNQSPLMKYPVGTTVNATYGFVTTSSTTLGFRVRDSALNNAQPTYDLSAGGWFGKWVALVGVRRPGGVAELWVGGVLRATATNAAVGSTDNTADLNVGRVYTTNSLPMDVACFGLWARAFSTREIEQISADPFGPFRPARRVIVLVPQLPAAGGTTFQQSMAGSITASGALVKQAQKPLGGSSTLSGVLIRETQRVFAGSSAGSGTLLKEVQKTLAGSMMISGALETIKIVLISLAGSLTPSGALLKRIDKLFAGSSAGSGALQRETQKTLAGSSAASGALQRRVDKTLTGSATPSGTLSVTRVVLLVLAGSITATGQLLKRAELTFQGQIAASGTLRKVVALTLLGVLTPIGALLKRIEKFFVGSIAASGAGTFIIPSAARYQEPFFAATGVRRTTLSGIAQASSARAARRATSLEIDDG